MTTRHLLHDAGHCLRAAAPPVLALGVLTTTRSVLIASPTLSAAEGRLLLAWHVAIVVAALWLVAAVWWAAGRPRRDRRAFQRLQQLRDLAAEPNCALVHLQTTIWSAAAGQDSVVVNVVTGTTHRVWLSETAVPVGAFAVLERTIGGVRVVDWIYARQVGAAHRHERQHSVTGGPAGVLEHEHRDDVLQLIEETEQYLRQQEPRG